MEPHPHVLLEDVFTPAQLLMVKEELGIMEQHTLTGEHTGAAYRDGEMLKTNRAVWIPNHWESAIRTSLLENLFCDAFYHQIPCEWWKTCWRRMSEYVVLLSQYQEGAYYKHHFDTTHFTLLTWLHEEPKPFTGGDFIFTDYGMNLGCKNNTGVIFFGSMEHEVVPVQGKGRYTVTMFCNPDREFRVGTTRV